MRANLKKARLDAGLTQERLAGMLGVSERYYRMIEAGMRNGDFEMWDSLEDIFGVHQRKLREIAPNENVE